MLTFDEYMGFSDSEGAVEKKPSRIRQFFKKHGKKLAIGAGILGAGVASYLLGRHTGHGTSSGSKTKVTNATTKPKAPKVYAVAKPNVNAKSKINQNGSTQRANGLSNAQLQQLEAQANTQARRNTSVTSAKSPYSTSLKTAKQIKVNRKRYASA